ncbi:MAG: hypothetical protein ABEJ68_10335 [Halobacteriaceae archaeon]
MADLNDRGQMILVGGLAVAVSIVVLVVLLNSVIYTQNVATRSGNAAEAGAFEYRAVVTESVADLLDAENDRNYTDRAALTANVSAGIDEIDRLVSQQLAAALVHADLAATIHEGTRIVQDNSSRDLTDAAGAVNWTVTSNVTGVRSFVLTPSNITGDLQTADPSNDSTRIVVAGGGAEWRLHLYQNGSGSYLAVTDETGAIETESACGGISTGEEIDLIAGTANGTACSGLDFANGTAPPWTISVTYGNHTAGTYNLTVNSTDIGNLALPGSGDSPRWAPMAYSATLNLTYRTPDLLYETRVRVIPGEDDE